MLPRARAGCKPRSRSQCWNSRNYAAAAFGVVFLFQLAQFMRIRQKSLAGFLIARDAYPRKAEAQCRKIQFPEWPASDHCRSFRLTSLAIGPIKAGKNGAFYEALRRSEDLPKGLKLNLGHAEGNIASALADSPDGALYGRGSGLLAIAGAIAFCVHLVYLLQEYRVIKRRHRRFVVLYAG